MGKNWKDEVEAFLPEKGSFPLPLTKTFCRHSLHTSDAFLLPGRLTMRVDFLIPQTDLSNTKEQGKQRHSNDHPHRNTATPTEKAWPLGSQPGTLLSWQQPHQMPPYPRAVWWPELKKRTTVNE